MLTGIYTALITPMTADGQIDEPGLERLIEFQLTSSIAGLVPAGTTGESPTLSDEERQRGIECSCRLAGSQVSVIAGAGSNSTSHTLAACAGAARAGARGVLLVDPYYNGPSSLEIRCEYIAPVARRFPDLEIIPYVVPARTGTQLDPVDLALLATQFANVRTVKEASPNSLANAALTRRLCGHDFAILSGDDTANLPLMRDPEIAASGWPDAYRCETLVAGICTDVLGSTRHVYQDVELDFAPPWERLTMLEAVSRYAGIDTGSASVSELRTALDQRGITSDRITNDRELSWGEMVAEIFEAECVPQLIQPTLVVDHPREISPLTRVKRGDDRLVERFEAYVCGMELANAYSELTDPVEQIERFQAQRGADGPPLDRDFVRALGCGMPPAGGVGLGFDRLVMLLTDAPSIRDIIPFPLVKPRRD